MAFQHWVAYIRAGDCGNLSDGTTKERLRCPLFWCRESFDSLASTLQHVSECQWLSNTWYWCPYCCRPESFIVSEESCGDPFQPNIQRKDSKLRRAVTFFKQLGLKSCSRHKDPASTSVGESESFDNWLTRQHRSEMEDTSHQIPMRAELADCSGTFGDTAYSGKGAEHVHEMEDTEIDTSQDLDHLSCPTQDANSASQPYELDVDDLAMEPQLGGEAANPINSFSGIGAQFEAARHDTEPLEETSESPASAIGVPFSHQSTANAPPLNAEIRSTGPAYLGPDTVSLPEVVKHHWYQVNTALANGGSMAMSKPESSVCEGTALSTQSHVEELRETVRIFNEEWLRRCQSIPDLAQRASAFSPRSLLDTGVQMLQLIFRGGQPGTFDAVFALAHVACAATYIIHRHDRSHCWNEILQDMFQLQYIIQDKDDARLFSQLVDLLRWPQGLSGKQSCGTYFVDENSGTLVPLRRPVVGLEGLFSIESPDLQAPRCLKEPALVQSEPSVKDVLVVKECSKFLDGKLIRQRSFNES